MISVERAHDARFINAVANHDAVRPHLLGGAQAIDYTPVINDPNNYVLQGKYGGMVFHRLLPGLYEVHSQTLPEGRGKWTLEMAHSMLLWMFTRTDAAEIITRVPHGNEPARQLTLNVGAVLEQHVQAEVDGKIIVWGIYRLTIQDWIKTSPYLEQAGEMFHAKLHGEYARLGMNFDLHDKDAWHDRNAGMAYLMMIVGNAHKAVGFYNRWAAMAMAPMIGLVSLDPLVVDIRDAWLRVPGSVGQDFEVMEKRG